MTAILLSVTDLELLAAQAVKYILLALLFFGGGLNSFKMWKAGNNRGSVIRGSLAILFFALAVAVFKWIQFEGSLLRSDEYAIGTTLGYCQVFLKGKAIEFEYDINGTTYKNCNTYHPVPVEDIVVPNGRYYVRYSKQFPERGRIDFNKAVE